jgi:hypothetical protein
MVSTYTNKYVYAPAKAALTIKTMDFKNHPVSASQRGSLHPRLGFKQGWQNRQKFSQQVATDANGSATAKFKTRRRLLFYLSELHRQPRQSNFVGRLFLGQHRRGLLQL